MSAVTQSRMDGREVVRCECSLVQFKAVSGLCLKSICRKPYVDPENDDSSINPSKTTHQDARTAKVSTSDVAQHPLKSPLFALPAMVKFLRERAGMSQRGLAEAMGTPRTYVSKVENSKATPTLSSFERICRALDISMENFMYLCETL